MFEAGIGSVGVLANWRPGLPSGKAISQARIGRVVYLQDTPQIRGMIRKVHHLVRIEQAPTRRAFIGEDDLSE